MKKIFLFLLLIPFQLKAEIILDKVIVDFLPNQPKQQNIVVFDNDKDTEYVDTEIFEIVSPGMKDEKRVKVDKNTSNRLVVAPQKLTIGPNMKKRFQFIDGVSSDLKKDKIYRVTVSPKVAGIKASGGNIGIKLLIGYDVLVIIRPNKLNFSVDVKKDKNSITFKNIGNTNVLLENVKQCDEKGKCTNILSDRLYAGNQKIAKLIYPNKPVLVEMYYANELKKATY